MDGGEGRHSVHLWHGQVQQHSSEVFAVLVE